VVDIHSHILPEVDDGSKSWETSVAMCRMAAADGITHQVATPHANDRYHYDRADYLQGSSRTCKATGRRCAQAQPGLRLPSFLRQLQDVLANPARYAIEGSHYMLVELSNYSVPQQTTDCFMQLGDRGITAVITHPERNPILRESPQRVVEWAEQGCVIQITGSALTGFWGERVRRAATG
jgi:protein-tyrosine phosphatase